MLSDSFGPPQIAAVLILLQRGLEELHSQRNTRRLLQQGAQEVGRDYYPVVAATHLAWIASLAFLVPPSAPVYVLPLIAFLALQPVRYWIIGTLGRYWTHRIITLPEAPIVTRGPYRFVSHPNYAVTLAETLLCRWRSASWRSASSSPSSGGRCCTTRSGSRMRRWQSGAPRRADRDERSDAEPRALPAIAVGGGLAGAAFALDAGSQWAPRPGARAQPRSAPHRLRRVPERGGPGRARLARARSARARRDHDHPLSPGQG